MTYTPEKLAARLSSEGQKTEDFFSHLPDKVWELQVYADGEHGQVRQVLSHLAQAEGSILRLLKSIMGGSGGTPEDFDLDAYNERKVKEIEMQDAAGLVRAFREARRQTVEWVSALRAEDLQRTGRHPFLGLASLEEIIKLMYRHTQLHQRDIRKLMRAGS